MDYSKTPDRLKGIFLNKNNHTYVDDYIIYFF
mgnify:CR=1 FL=1